MNKDKRNLKNYHQFIPGLKTQGTSCRFLVKKEGERLDNQLEEEKKEVPNAGLEDQKESVHK